MTERTRAARTTQTSWTHLPLSKLIQYFMGFNHNLKQDESFNFKLQITSQLNPMLKVFGLRSGGVLLEKATITSIMEGAEKLYTGSFQQIILYLKVIK